MPFVILFHSRNGPPLFSDALSKRIPRFEGSSQSCRGQISTSQMWNLLPFPLKVSFSHNIGVRQFYVCFAMFWLEAWILNSIWNWQQKKRSPFRSRESDTFMAARRSYSVGTPRRDDNLIVQTDKKVLQQTFSSLWGPSAILTVFKMYLTSWTCSPIKNKGNGLAKTEMKISFTHQQGHHFQKPWKYSSCRKLYSGGFMRLV